MNKVIGVLIGGISSYVLGFGSIFAAQGDVGFCGATSQTHQYGYANISSIYPVSLYIIAYTHHLNYCYRNYNNLLTEEEIQYVEANPTDEYIESPWLYDHMIDVGFRYVDGDQNLQYENAVVDVQGAQWRKQIKELAEKENGAVVGTILDSYRQYWGDGNFDLDITQGLSQSCNDTHAQSRMSDYNVQRGQIPLTKKYYIMCEVSSCMVNNEKNSFLSSCYALARERVQNEVDSVQVILINQGGEMIRKNLDLYARSYTTHNRMDTLIEKIVMMSKGLGFIDQKVPEMTKMCSA